MEDVTTLRREDFDNLGTTKSNLQTISKHLKQIGEDIREEAPAELKEFISEPTVSRIRPQNTEKGYRNYMWAMYGRADEDRGTHNLVHPEFLIGEDSEGPFVDVRYNAGTDGGASPDADQREILTSNIEQHPELFLDFLSRFEEATVDYKLKYGDSYTKSIEEFGEDDIGRISNKGLKRLSVKRRYHESDDIFEESFVREMSEIFSGVLFPLLGFALDDVPEVVINYVDSTDLQGGSEEKSNEEPERSQKIARQLEKTKQVVFYGPPGTGKTYSAKLFADWWVDKGPTPTESTSQVRVVTFHPSFSYEDFLEGLSAKASGDGTVEYKIKPGRFKRVCEDAKRAYEESDDGETPPRFLLVIDEINRGNLAQIFGETITQLEADKRLNENNEVRVNLAHSGDSFVVPPNLYIIGTMNTADRSIALVDAALRRRFRFINFPPDYEALFEEYDFDDWISVKTAAESGSSARSLLALSILSLRDLNEIILNLPELGKGKQIGHSYLFGHQTEEGELDEKGIVDTWKYEILPLIEEYYFGQFDRIEQDLLGGTDDLLIDWDTKQIKDFDSPELYTALSMITDVSSGDGSSDTQQTVDILTERGVLEPGDVLEFNREWLRNGSTVSDSDLERAENIQSEDFWRVEVVNGTAVSGEVRWMHDGGMYSLSGAANEVLREITDGEVSSEGQPDHWRHPEFNSRNLYELRDEDVDDTERRPSEVR